MKNFLPYIKIARFDHWIKQLFVLPGCIFCFFFNQQLLSDWKSYLSPIVYGLIVTSLIASANYVINEWLDSKFDQFHPIKKNRPVVEHRLNPIYIISEYLVLLTFGLLGSILFISKSVFYMELWLAIMGIIYNVNPIRSKDIPYIDVLSESLNNLIRLLIGWFVISPHSLPPISIAFGYWMGGAFLMSVKRFAEYRMINDPVIAGKYRKSFQYYTEQSLLISSFFYAILSVFFTGIFLIKYHIEFIFTIPAICGLFCLYFKIAYKADSAVQRPEKLFREKGLMLYCLFLFFLFIILLFIKIPHMQFFLGAELINF